MEKMIAKYEDSIEVIVAEKDAAVAQKEDNQTKLIYLEKDLNDCNDRFLVRFVRNYLRCRFLFIKL